MNSLLPKAQGRGWAVVLIVTLFCSSCSKKRASHGIDFAKANTVTAVLGEPEQELGGGLQHLHFIEDGRTIPATLDEIPCRYLALEGTNFGYFYFSIDRAFKKRDVSHVRIEVEYADPQPGLLGLQFDAAVPKGNPELAYTGVNPDVRLEGTKTWKTAVFHVQGATFKGAENSGADFRLCVRPPDLYVRKVTVTRIKN